MKSDPKRLLTHEADRKKLAMPPREGVTQAIEAYTVSCGFGSVSYRL